jgi:LysR family transcriptional regulator, benzoate and cis,cis-muconate-responsive activator of ben and cat genes
MELRHLRYFIAVATDLHFGRAAAKLDMAQPPLSQQIRQLEDEVGAKLLHRTKRRVQLTNPGRTFLEEARAIVARADEAVAKTRRTERGDTGRLSIGWQAWSDWTDLPRRLGKFGAQNPDVQLEIHNLGVGDQIAALHSGRIDIGFLLRPFGAEKPQPLDTGALKTKIVLRHPLVAVLPKTHELSVLKQIPFRRLAGAPYISFKRESAPVFYDSVVSLYNRHGLAFKVRHEADHPSTVLGLVTAGLGITLLPLGAQHMSSGVVFRAVSPRLPTVDIALGWRAENESPLLTKFIKLMRE